MNCVRLVILALCACVVFSFAPAAQAQSAVTGFFAARRVAHPLPAASLYAAQSRPSDYAGQTFEVTARVSGFVSADDVRTALLSLGALSLAARLPAERPENTWLTSGQTVRALVRVDKTGNDLGLSHLTLLAAAPEADLDALPPSPLSRSAPRTPYTSRSWSYEGRRPTRSAWAPSYAVPVAAPPGLTPRAQAIYAPYWNAVRGMNPRLSTSDVDKITSSILYFSDRNDIDPRLIMAMIICESGFDTHSTSRTGAMGLGQLMPATARGLGVTDAYDPVQNIAASVRLLRGHLDNYGGAPAHAGIIPLDQIALTMAAYNAGPGAVRRFHGVPPYRETRRYVAKVAALYAKMCGSGG